jgi:hypothetical protein
LGIGAVSVATADALPGRLELEYSLSRGNMEIGEVSRRLERRPDGSYAHSMWTRPTGFAKLLTSTEWREEGEFVVQGAEVLPQRFSETRAGDKRAYEHRVTFDRARSQLAFEKNPPQPLPRGLQDQGNIIYALMLNPLTQPGERSLPQTDGKVIETYLFSYQGKESLPTPFGTRETVIVRRVSQKRLEREQQCRAQNLKEPDCTQPDDFTFWLLPEKRYIPVKLERRRKDETTTMLLRAARGL